MRKKGPFKSAASSALPRLLPLPPAAAAAPFTLLRRLQGRQLCVVAVPPSDDRPVGFSDRLGEFLKIQRRNVPDSLGRAVSPLDERYFRHYSQTAE